MTYANRCNEMCVASPPVLHCDSRAAPERIGSRLARRYAGAVLLAAATGAFSPMAAAVDGKTYPGAACQPGELNSPTDIQYTWLGHAKNILPGNSLGVVCPIVRDNMGSVSGIGYASVRINKTNNTGFVCELRSRNAHSTAGFLQTQWNFDGAGNRTITFNGPASGYASGYYVLSCYIPPGHQLLSYRVDEN